ncbi:hypothetical protein, partial [Saccharothrix sp. ST-888]|uniref:hypothetical protein n=1 Tax=Saccharothrix sp. ST-888 TaxID=1427391 RepID=UPI0005EC2DAC
SKAQIAQSQLFSHCYVRRLAQTAIPAVGAGIGDLATSAGAPVLDVVPRHIGDYGGAMTAVLDDGDTVEVNNLNAILEHRHHGGLPVSSSPRTVVAP